jgi:hypothetical protein
MNMVLYYTVHFKINVLTGYLQPGYTFTNFLVKYVNLLQTAAAYMSTAASTIRERQFIYCVHFAPMHQLFHMTPYAGI